MNEINSLIHYSFLLQEIVSEIQIENTIFTKKRGEIIDLFEVEELLSNKDPQNDFYHEEPQN